MKSSLKQKFHEKILFEEMSNFTEEKAKLLSKIGSLMKDCKEYKSIVFRLWNGGEASKLLLAKMNER